MGTPARTLLLAAVALACAPAGAPAQAGRLGPGAWSYFGDPRAVHRDGVTYAGAIEPRGDVVVYAYRASTGQVRRAVVRTGLGADDHNNPSLLIRPDGRLQVFYSPHSGRHLPRSRHSRMHFRIARRPGSLRFGPERRLRTNSRGDLGYTYPNPVLGAGRTWLFWRGGNWFPTFSRSKDGRHWTRARTLVRGPQGHRPYAKYAGRGSKVHAVFSDGHVASYENGLHYLAIRRGRVLSAAGRTLGRLDDLPLSLSETDPVRRFDPATGRAWPHDLAVGADGRPVVLYTLRRGSSGYGSDTFHYARFDGSSWVSHPIVWAGKRSKTYTSGGATLDHEDPSVVYLSRHDGIRQVVEVHRTPDHGASWQVTPVAAPPDGLFAIRPLSPRGLVGTDQVLWLSGIARSFEDFDTSIHLWSGSLADPGGTVEAPQGAQP